MILGSIRLHCVSETVTPHKMVNNFSIYQKMNRDINSFSNIHDTMDPTEDIIMCFTLTSRFLALFLHFLPKCINVLRSDIDVLIKNIIISKLDIISLIFLNFFPGVRDTKSIVDNLESLSEISVKRKKED